MPRITLAIKTPFGEIMINGESPQEIIDALKGLDQEFIGDVGERVSELLTIHARDDLKGIVEVGRDGPVILTKKKLSHYEAIGLILYSMKDNQASSREITRRLAASGKKVTVPARLHEMRKRGHIFKPVDRAPYYKLSTRGVKWIEEEVLPPLKKK
ncbi:MAG: hypothetical protein NWE75_01515 [Candidatus Bathyarchaeota archaeon]|jgi:hypothetical protein|nr:hypothetical protein [Candidatus Bathyarchaeota archaeon]